MERGVDIGNLIDLLAEAPPPQRRPLTSLGNEAQFLDAILGQILHQDTETSRTGILNRQSLTPTAPPVEFDEPEWRHELLANNESPREDRSSHFPTAPPQRDSSFGAKNLVSDDEDNVSYTPTEPLRENSSYKVLEEAILREDGSTDVPIREDSARRLEVASQEDRLPDPTALHGDPSYRLLELVTALADNLSPPEPDPCEMVRCNSWEFNSMGNLDTSLPDVRSDTSSTTCSSVESLTQFDSFLQGLSQRDIPRLDEDEIGAIECQCLRTDLPRGSAARASMYVPKCDGTQLPERPRSASPNFVEPCAPTTSHNGNNTAVLPWLQRMRSASLSTTRPERAIRPRANSFSSAEMALKQTTQWACDPSEPSTSRPTNWLRMSMRRVRHFRLVDPPNGEDSASPPEAFEAPRPRSAPVSERPRQYGRAASRRPVSASSTEAPAVTDRPSRGQRRRISSSRRRSAPSPDPESDWRRYRLSSDSSSDSEEIPTPIGSPQHAASPVSNLSSYEMTRDNQSPLGQWPHGMSSMLACLGCTLGLFNISRFAILSVQFGANFILQFLVMSLLVGIPLFTFHASLGQLLAAGTMDMWRISPVFQGIGIALLISQALIGIYSIVGVSWMFIYFRDSFITKQDVFRWAEPFHSFRDDGRPILYNTTIKLEETVPDYFNGVVLQRHNLESPSNSPGHLKFQVTFNLAVVWMMVFISLSKGLKSYGKVVYLFSLVPVFGMLILCSKLLGLMPSEAKLHLVFPEADWSEFFLNTKSWMAASTEAFYTWGMLGAAAMQIASHNRPKHFLHRDTTFVIILTLSILMLAAFLANTCAQILQTQGYLYLPSSFERMSTYAFLHPVKTPLPNAYAGTPVRWMPHSQFIAGETVILPGTNPRQQSGYQVLRLATELVPSTLALIGANKLSPFWSVLFYFVLIMFGIAQQLAIWHCLITGIIAINVKKLKYWETTITFFTCACGFVLGLPMTTELGIFVVYYLDYCVGGGWWVMVLYLAELTAVFMVRGRPYSGETVVAALFSRAGSFLQNWVAPMLSFIWNVILPVLLMVQFVTVFKNGHFRDLLKWNSTTMFYDYWPPWTREFGSLLQIVPLLMIPFIGLVQSCRYLSSGSPDIFDRIQLLYRPPLDSISNLQDLSPDLQTTATTNSSGTNPVEDPPPKYTPPPSYTTATGARIAKILRQSFRHSMRRLAHVIGTSGESSEVPAPRARMPLPPPPDYSAVLVEINQSLASNQSDVVITVSEVDRVRTDPITSSSTLTANDVATILRSSFRRAVRDNVIESSSSERLVDAAAPINHDSIVLETDKERSENRH